MNPFCRKHRPPVLMLTKLRKTSERKDPITGEVIKGVSKVFECPRCKARLKKGRDCTSK